MNNGSLGVLVWAKIEVSTIWRRNSSVVFFEAST